MYIVSFLYGLDSDKSHRLFRHGNILPPPGTHPCAKNAQEWATRQSPCVFVAKTRSRAHTEALRHPKSQAQQIPCGSLPWNPTLAQKTRKNGAPIVRELAGVYCLILGFTAE
jgi:hypothetical protein